MPQEYTNAAKNIMLEALIDETIWVSAHTASPGLTGANEVSGGSPAYARKQLTYGAAASGAADISASATLDIPASTSVTFLGIWDAVTGGVFLGQSSIATETFGSQGTLEVTEAELNLNNDPA